MHMSENPIHPKTIERLNAPEETILFDRQDYDVTFTSDWVKVEGAKGVACRTWKIEGVETNVDGADIIIEAGGYTPIQLVQAAEIVVDAPEAGEAWCVVMDTDGQIYINYFDGSEKQQMEWGKGMIITWIAKTEVKLTEFESPSFNDDMFATVPEDKDEFQGRPMIEYLKIVKELRNLATLPAS